MASNNDWYRSENWEEEDKKLFELKLSRAKGAFSKSQYIRIKATYMSYSKNPDIRKASRELFKRVIEEYPDEISQVKESYEQLGTSYQQDGLLKEAEDMYRMAIKVHNKNIKDKGFHINSEFLLAELLVSSDDIEKNKDAELIFDELSKREHYFIFNDQIFRYYLARTRLARKLHRDDSASVFAASALKIAEKGQVPQFPRHKDIGLVKVNEQVIKELTQLAGDTVIQDEKATILKLLNSGLVHFNYKNPTFNESAGSIYKEDEKTLFLPIINKFLKGADLDNFTVRMGFRESEYILVSGELKSATSSDDIDFVFNELLKDHRWKKEDAHDSLFDKRNGKPRKHRYKLKIKHIVIYERGIGREMTW